jgi:Repeat of unknown function (DUF5907)
MTTKISGMTVADLPLAGDEEIELSIPGSPRATRKATVQDVADLAAVSGGTVTSVAATVPSFLSVAGSPITGAGTLALSYSGTALPIANGGTASTTASAARTALGLAIGTDVQGYTAALAAVSGTNSGDQTITLTGNVTGSGTGSFAATIANDAVTYAKMQNVSATDKLLGRSTAGAGDVEEIALTAAGRALIDDADAAAQRTTLGLGTLATQSGTFSGTSSNTNTGDQTSIVGITGTIAQFNTAVTDADLAVLAANTFTGAQTAPSFIPNSATVPANGVYLPAVNIVGIAANTTEAVRVTSAGIGVNTSSITSLGGNILVVDIAGTSTTRGGAVNVKTSDNSLNGNFYAADGVVTIGSGSSHPLVFAIANTEVSRFDTSKNLIHFAPATPPSLTVNGTLVMNLTSNTNLRISVRGSDGTTRVANITLA